MRSFDILNRSAPAALVALALTFGPAAGAAAGDRYPAGGMKRVGL